MPSARKSHGIRSHQSFVAQNIAGWWILQSITWIWALILPSNSSDFHFRAIFQQTRSNSIHFQSFYVNFPLISFNFLRFSIFSQFPHRHCLFFGAASRHISSGAVSRKSFICSARAMTLVISDTLIVRVYFTYLLFNIINPRDSASVYWHWISVSTADVP